MVTKTLYNSDVSGTRTNVPDVIIFGDGDMFQLICKASSIAEGWMKSTKACFTGLGCFVQVTTQQRNPDGSYAVAEALAYAPGICVVDLYDSGGTLKGRAFAEMSSADSAPSEPYLKTL